jgi:hypothetical protein
VSVNVKAKRRAAIPKAPRQESAAEGGTQETTAAAQEADATGFAPGSLTLSEHLPPERFVRIEIPGEAYLPCNPSIAKDANGNLACLVRTVNYELGEEDGIWFRGDPAPNTRNYFVPIGSNLAPGVPQWVDDLTTRHTRVPARDGLEDARLFWWHDAWHFTCSALHHGPRVRTTMALCKLEEGRVTYLEFLPSPHGREMEKNWAPQVKDDRLSFIYAHHPSEAYELWPTKRRLYLNGYTDLERWSGGSQVIEFDGALVSIVHQRRKERNRVYYVHRMVRYGENLEPVHAGREFFFKGKQIEFCAGLVEQQGRLIASFGVKDRESWLVSLTKNQVASLLA